MTEQEVYRSILEKMLNQTEQREINSPKEFLHQLTKEIEAATELSPKQ
ncbi:hypothetical protein [Gracilibacillus alcaliphilus]|nr:hypothetical protein [Gracilibacillus alcaliphilus]MBM7679519.1 hypothetical protein [Gracilibacillus alcaliphilus]